MFYNFIFLYITYELLSHIFCVQGLVDAVTIELQIYNAFKCTQQHNIWWDNALVIHVYSKTVLDYLKDCGNIISSNNIILKHGNGAQTISDAGIF